MSNNSEYGKFVYGNSTVYPRIKSKHTVRAIVFELSAEWIGSKKKSVYWKCRKKEQPFRIQLIFHLFRFYERYSIGECGDYI